MFLLSMLEQHNYSLILTFSVSRVTADSLSYALGLPFSTWDADHSGHGCAASSNSHGAWWYANCYHSNLNGLYDATYSEFASWHMSNGLHAVKTSTMMMRPDTDTA